ncbi:MAG: adenylate/guanylate cyclase domain-containing protein [Leptolyngbyaceae bacterium]|nr:adenylate/guanylate cyclase domain-containing protein [Leptolyngbyaceae bacterium]
MVARTAMSLEKIASYVPRLLVDRAYVNPTPPETPVVEQFPAAILFADISGFTALTERLAGRGPAGIEELTHHLSSYFTHLIRLIHVHGGDVIKFAGDALMALWPAQEVSLATVTHHAAQCSLAIMTELHHYQAADMRFSLHIGMGAGDITGLHVGGVQNRWEFLVAGQPLLQMASAAAQAKSGEVCISAESWALIQARCTGTVLETGHVRLDAVQQSLLPPAAVLPTITPEMVTVLRRYTPHGILARLDVGQTQWLAELRRITVLFASLPDLEYPPTGSLESVQQAMQAMQSAIYQYEGSVRQFIKDDKGSVLVAAFGLPPLAHEDNAERALLAGLALQENLLQMGLTSAIGITTGSVYCGSVGSQDRCEYTMIGDIVNLAARLMVSAKDGILCDQTTYQGAQARLLFERLPPIQVKGKSELIPVYRPLASAQSASEGWKVPHLSSPSSPLVGRLAEQALLHQKLQALQAGTSSNVVIEGEPGIGKSRLIEELRSHAQGQGITVLSGASDAIAKSTPYHAWRSLFSQLLGLQPFTDPEAQRTQVLTQLSGGINGVDLSRFAPLLKAVVPLDLPDNEITVQMTGQVRAENIQDLLVHLLQQSAQQSPLLVILEDAHWLDSASWALALAISQRVHPLMLVVSTRPLRDPLPIEYQQLLQQPHSQTLTLAVLACKDALELVCQRLGVSHLPDVVANLIRQKAEGNPFFSEQLAYSLQDAGLIRVKDGRCELGAGIASLGAEGIPSLRLPDTVQGVIISRLDRLTPGQQLTLKVASVVGRTFTAPLIHHTYPIAADQAQIPNYLNTLERLDFTLQQSPALEVTYLFKHIITQEVAYNLMLYVQRRHLHQSVAEWYEATYASDLSPFYALLAYHWTKAEIFDKAIDFLEKAGEQARRSNSLQEAVQFFSQAIALDQQLNLRLDREEVDSLNQPEPSSISPPKFRQALWERQLGEAYLGLGQLSESREHLARALILLNRPMPTLGVKLLASMLGQLIRQSLHRLGYLNFQTNSPEEVAPLLETARIYDLFAELYYHANEVVPTLYAALRTLNLAERAGPSPELARAYASSCFASGMMGLHRLAKAYSHQARLTAQIVNQPIAAEARVLIVTSAYGVGVGQWQAVETALGQASQICDRFEDRHQLGTSLAILAKAAYLQGKFARGIELWTKVYTAAHHSGDVLQQAWGLNGQAEGLLRLGDTDTAVNLLEASLHLFAQNTDRVSETATSGMLAIARWRQGKLDLAQQAAQETAHRLDQLSSPSSYYLIEGYAGVAQVYLGLWQVSRDKISAETPREKSPETSTELESLAQSARSACRALHQFARVFPIGQPSAWLWQGLYHWLANQPAQAQQAWQRSLAAAEQFAMPYDQGLAHYEIGRHAISTQRQHHLKIASQIFTELDAAFDLARAEAALSPFSELHHTELLMIP